MLESVKGFGTLPQGHVARKGTKLESMLWKLFLQKLETGSILREHEAFGYDRVSFHNEWIDSLGPALIDLQSGSLSRIRLSKFIKTSNLVRKLNSEKTCTFFFLFGLDDAFSSLFSLKGTRPPEQAILNGTSF
jgi:hypothetical protein